MSSGEASEIAALPPNAKKAIVKATMVSNRIPLAALGYDPRKVFQEVLTKKEKIATAGAYDPNSDSIFSFTAFESTIVHESIHRGLQKLKEQYPEEVKELLPKGFTEEYAVRWIMQEEAGNPEKGDGPENDKQIAAADYIYSNSSERREAVENLQKLAQRAIKDKNPRGPR